MLSVAGVADLTYDNGHCWWYMHACMLPHETLGKPQAAGSH